MNAAHLHLLMNHVPILGFVFGAAILAAGLWRRSRELQTAALWCLVVAAAVSIPVFVTGEPAEEVIEHLPGVAESAIERHEDAAKIAFGALLAAGVAAGLGLAVGRVWDARWFPAVVLGLVVFALACVTWAAHLGGLIRHPEIASVQAVSARGEADDD